MSTAANSRPRWAIPTQRSGSCAWPAPECSRTVGECSAVSLGLAMTSRICSTRAIPSPAAVRASLGDGEQPRRSARAAAVLGRADDDCHARGVDGAEVRNVLDAVLALAERRDVDREGRVVTGIDAVGVDPQADEVALREQELRGFEAPAGEW
jgi:hypothetical protein